MENKIDFLTKELVEQAALRIDKKGIPKDRESTVYFVVIKGNSYPFKMLVTTAAEIAGQPINHQNFKSNSNYRQVFEELTGFECINTNNQEPYFQLSQIPAYLREVNLKYNKISDGAKFSKDTRSKLQYLGKKLGDDLNVDLVNNYNERPDKMAGYGKGLVLKSYILAGFIPSNYDVGKELFVKLNFHVNEDKFYFGIDVDVNFSDNGNPYNSKRNELQKDTLWVVPVDTNFPKNWKDLIDLVKPVFAKNIAFIHSFFSEKKILLGMTKFIEILVYKKQIILQGPPGTGKTYTAKDMAEQMIYGNISEDKKTQKKKLDESGQFKLVQFHPSYSYEDFVRGITAKSEDGGIVYETENKTLALFADKAQQNILSTKAAAEVAKQKLKKYVLVIDEINRANLPSVLGELIYALEYRDETVETMYAFEGDNEIVIPNNLYIIGTMNTADRSVGHIDYAIKRRFAFVDVLPNEGVIRNEKAKDLFKMVARLFVKEETGGLSNSIFLASDFDYKDVQLGHSYFILKGGSPEEQSKELEMRLQYEIIPILNEYVKDGLLLETAKDEIKRIEQFEC